MFQKNDYIKQTIFILCTILAILIICICSILCPYLSDDWHFFFVWDGFDPNNHTRRVSSFADIITSMRNYYHFSGGRVIAHFLVYSLMTVNKMFFNIINGFMFAGMCLLLYSITQAISNIKSIWLYPLIILMCFKYLPSFGDVVLWLSGSVNYMWMSVPFLACITWLIRRREKAGLLERISIMPLFIFSAFTNEITGGMLAVAIILCLILSDKRRSFFLITYLISLIPGMCFVIMAPGNMVRKKIVEQNEVGISDWFNIVHKYFEYLGKEKCSLIVVMIFGFLFSFYNDLSWKDRLGKFIPLIVGLCGIIALSFTGMFTERPMIFGLLLMIPSTVCLCAEVYRQYKTTDMWKYILRFVKISILAWELYFLCFTENFEMVISVFCIGIIFMMLSVLSRIKQSDILNTIKRLCVRLYRCFGNISHNLLPAVVLVLCVMFGKSLYTYGKWTQDYYAFEREQVELIKMDKFESAMYKCRPEHRCNLVPIESVNVSKWYYIEWMAEYYGRDTKEFVQKYSETNRVICNLD